MRANRLDLSEVAWLRERRLKEIEMWAIIRELLIHAAFLSVLFLVTYSNVDPHAFGQVQHLRTIFHNTRQPNHDFTRVSRFSSLSEGTHDEPCMWIDLHDQSILDVAARDLHRPAPRSAVVQR